MSTVNSDYFPRNRLSGEKFKHHVHNSGIKAKGSVICTHSPLSTTSHFASLQSYHFPQYYTVISGPRLSSTKRHPVQEGILLGMGNPLLDISATVPDKLLAKHNLKATNAVLTEDEVIFTELTSNYPVDFIAGGATQNSIRVAQWVLGLKHATSFISSFRP